MDHFKLVLPEHLNHHGKLFGGYMLKWIDEFAYITANLDFPGNRFVTIALDNVEFRHGVKNGEILRFSIAREKLGNSSVHYKVSVYGTRRHGEPDMVLFETRISLVNIDESGTKARIARSES
ncbi:MAG: acyl-CoA thioesterase [Verrucomicrobiota bacterium]